MLPKKFLLALFVLFFTVVCYGETASDKDPATINLAGKEWKLKFKDSNNTSMILEYVTNNETVEKWNELFTYQKFSFAMPKEVTPTLFAEKEVAAITEKGYKSDYKIIEASSQEAVIEIRISSPANEQQDEIQRIIKTAENHIVVIHYVIRKNDMDETERTKWVNALKSFPI